MDYHLHTVHSFDGVQTVQALCEAMLQKGVQEICLTEHIEPGHPDPSCDVPPIWDIYLREIAMARAMYPLLTIRAGVEIGDNPPYRAKVREDLAALGLDFHLLSLHLVNGVDPYESEKYFSGKTREQAYRAYIEAKAESVCSWEDFDSVAHIGYASRYAPWDDRAMRYEDAPDAFDAIFRHIIERGKCLEVNTGGLKSTGDFLPAKELIKRYIELGGENFTFGSDAHDTDRAYADIEAAKDLVRSLGGKYQASFCAHVPTFWAI